MIRNEALSKKKMKRYAFLTFGVRNGTSREGNEGARSSKELGDGRVLVEFVELKKREKRELSRMRRVHCRLELMKNNMRKAK